MTQTLNTNDCKTPRIKVISDLDVSIKPKSVATQIMGIINLTPDSFSQDGLIQTAHAQEHTLAIAQKMIQDGADILDLGGESTRPGAREISIEEELNRILPALKKIKKNTTVPISIDTYKPDVAKAALDEGATIINNIKGTQILSTDILNMIKNYNASIVLMHCQGTPQTMQDHIHYTDVIGDIYQELDRAVQKCLECGIAQNHIIIDPGIGFGKTVEHNLELINKLSEFKKLNCPILIGPSRKSFIGKIINQDVTNRLYGTIASVCAGILNGASIVRVHDIKSVTEAARVTDAIMNQTYQHLSENNT